MSDDEKLGSDKDADRYLKRMRKKIRRIFSDDRHPNRNKRVYEALGVCREVRIMEKLFPHLKAAIDRRAIKKGYHVAPNKRRRYTQIIKVMIPKCPTTSIHRYAVVLRYAGRKGWPPERLLEELSKKGGMRRIEESEKTRREKKVADGKGKMKTDKGNKRKKKRRKRRTK